jgi:hypothetical protein
MSESSILETPETLKARGRCHLLLLPEEKPYPDYLKKIRQGASLQETLAPV